MANNIISDWLFDFADGADIPEDDETYDYAAKLDRLVEAAREARKAISNSNADGTVGDLLAAALREIELDK